MPSENKIGGQGPALCYVLMPFTPALRETYEDAIKPAVQDASEKWGVRITCRRGDEIIGPGSITRDIVSSIYTARVVIADLTANNPNVFYELGIAHCMGNKTIMITQSVVDTPFDVSTYRLLKYEASAGGLAALRRDLADAVLAVCKSETQQATNPVEDFVPTRYTNVVITLEELQLIECRAARRVWIIEPTLEADLKLFQDVIKENVEKRSIHYRYLIPDDKQVLRSVMELRETLGLDEEGRKRIAVRVTQKYMMESEVVIYDAYDRREQVFMMSSPEDEHPFWFRIRGSRAKAIRERYEALWEDAVQPKMD